MFNRSGNCATTCLLSIFAQTIHFQGRRSNIHKATLMIISDLSVHNTPRVSSGQCGFTEPKPLLVDVC